jgi:hypothetical protein
MHTGESLVDELTKLARGQRDPRRRCMNARTQGCERWVDAAPHDVPVGTDHDDRPWRRDPVGTPHAPGPVRREVRAGPNTHRPGELHDRTGRGQREVVTPTTFSGPPIGMPGDRRW